MKKAKRNNLRKKQPLRIKFVSYNDERIEKELIKKIYQNYLNEFYTHKDMEKVTINHLENAFIDKVYYLAMKDVPLIEKKILYLSLYENHTLNYVCKRLQLTRTQVLMYRKSGLEHFKKNVKKYAKIYGKGGVHYE